MINNPAFVISLDFELFWGVRDHRSIKDYGQAIIGARKAIPEMLNLFKQYNIHATWATVGLLFHESKTQLIKNIPELKPEYCNKNLSPYHSLHLVGENEQVDPYHFGLSLIKQIQDTPFQEIATHTFGHYYCLEKGQSIETFEADLKQAIISAQQNNLTLTSIVFPRNQFNEKYLQLLKSYGINAYRGNEKSWLYKPKNKTQESSLRRLIRLIDSYINLSGHHIYKLNVHNNALPLNIPASRFLRPYSPKLKMFDVLKLNRIKRDMLAAAKQGKVFHLWWHPHNFGTHLAENLEFLEAILKYYEFLRKQYNMQSLTMAELTA